MYKNNKVALILLMGGTGKRFSSSLPKQFHNLSGIKIYLHTLKVFNDLDIFDEIIIPCHRDYMARVKEEIKEYKNSKVVEGGRTRQESSYRALKGLNKPRYVMIHDIVRPFVSKRIVMANLTSLLKHKAIDTCIKSKDTLVEINTFNQIDTIPNRSFLLRGQTPQSFEYDLILNAHKRAVENNIKNATDDCQLVLDKTKVFVVEGDETNIKITSKLDLFLAEQLFRLKKTNVKKSKKSLSGKTFALVGASGGIGVEIKKLLKKEKAKILEISRTSTFKTDISNFENVKDTFSKIYKNFGKIDGLINAAGLFLVKPLKNHSPKEIEDLIKVNLLGLVYTCKEAKIKDGGHIINISSSSYSLGRKNYGIYSATKAGVVNFTQSLAEEREHQYINVIVPQRTNTKMRKKFFPLEDKSILLDPKDLAKSIVNVLKENITKSIIEIKI